MSTSRISEEPDRDALLSALQAHGQSFLSSFGHISQPTEPNRKRRKIELEPEQKLEWAEDSGDEWHGFGSSDVSLDGNDSEDASSAGIESDGGEAIEDDEFRSDIPSKKQPEVVVFSAAPKPDHPNMSKLQAKAFMAISKLRDEGVPVSIRKEAAEADNNYMEERTNIQNDALLHKLVHTQLLSGSLNSDLNLTPAQRRKALEGRVLELADSAKLGKGEASVRQEERRKASKKVRMGLERKVDERKSKALEEAKNLGNYHHSIKHIFEASSDGQPDRRKRERGLKMGVGKFSHGVLKLSRDDVASLQVDGGPTSGRGGATRGRGRSMRGHGGMRGREGARGGKPSSRRK
ncbi:hypothetical protein EW145_g50 [Phellinidium pouzarii]|uniref:Uncharacterized protein n=1 Tax=Phellinidium pouzarii TaxID=167371 RepID=A0A4S4LKG4_9AGAM|nr:hypothetical protein EW145_g50 [Phellinidium pouzarii]